MKWSIEEMKYGNNKNNESYYNIVEEEVSMGPTLGSTQKIVASVYLKEDAEEIIKSHNESVLSKT